MTNPLKNPDRFDDFRDLMDSDGGETSQREAIQDAVALILELKQALVTAAIPIEALLMVYSGTRHLSDVTLQRLREAQAAIRTALEVEE